MPTVFANRLAVLVLVIVVAVSFVQSYVSNNHIERLGNQLEAVEMERKIYILRSGQPVCFQHRVTQKLIGLAYYPTVSIHLTCTYCNATYTAFVPVRRKTGRKQTVLFVNERQGLAIPGMLFIDAEVRRDGFSDLLHVTLWGQDGPLEEEIVIENRQQLVELSPEEFFRLIGCSRFLQQLEKDPKQAQPRC